MAPCCSRLLASARLAAAVGGTVGIGGSVAVINIQSKPNAFIGAGAIVDAGVNGDVVVAASLVDNVTGNAYAGAAGIVGLGAQVCESFVVLETFPRQVHFFHVTFVRPGSGIRGEVRDLDHFRPDPSKQCACHFEIVPGFPGTSDHEEGDSKKSCFPCMRERTFRFGHRGLFVQCPQDGR